MFGLCEYLIVLPCYELFSGRKQELKLIIMIINIVIYLL
jgi:hypothetical protein